MTIKVSRMLDSAPQPGGVRKTAGRLLCTAGRHWWEPQHHPDWDGADAVYFTCRRCAAERPGDDGPA
jgi:hypothetical protein